MSKIIGSSNDVLKAFRTSYRGNSTLAKMRCAALAACIYHIWNARNMTLFDNEKMNAANILRKIKLIIFRFVPRSLNLIESM